MESDIYTANDYLAIINKRRWSFFIPCIVVLLSSIVISLFLPSIYKSSAKILVKQSEIPSYYVKQGVTSYAEVRYRYIKHEILTLKRLKDMIEQHKLYPGLQKELPMEEIVSLVRNNINIQNVSEEEYFSGVSIAFVLSYEDRDPQVAQQVTKLLTAMFLEENINIRKRQSSETTLFLEREINKLEKALDVIEGQIGSFKKKYINELPSLLQVNIQSLQRVELKREEFEEQLLSKKDIRQSIKVQMEAIPRHNRGLTDQGKLVKLEAQLVNLRSQYAEAYPDVIRLKDELVKLKERINTNQGEDKSNQKYFYNPTHVNLSSQLSAVSTEINSLQRQLEELDTKQDEYQKRIETTLRIEDDYTAFVNNRKNTQAKYNDLVKKLMDAKVSHGLEEEQKGERFTLIRRANYPMAPYKPNRLAIILLGCFAGFGLGTGIVAIQEYMDHSIRDGDMLANFSLGPVLGSIPIIVPEENVARTKRIGIVIVTLVLAVSIGIFLTETYFSSFNVIESVDKINAYFSSFNVIESVNQVIEQIKEGL